MSNNLPASIFPKQFQILSGSALKMIAIITMFIDHLGAIILSKLPAANEYLFYIGSKGFTIYKISRDIGRVAFPIFCFLLVEGFIHTRNRFRYGRNLLIFALISELPWNIWHGGLSHPKQNIFFTLFFGYLAYCAIEHFYGNQKMQFICMIALFYVAYNFNADYGWKGYIFLLIMYFFRFEKATQAIVGSCWLHYEWKACFAFISINMYNGERGFIKGKFGKYFFYAFYPVHIILLLLVKKFFL